MSNQYKKGEEVPAAVLCERLKVLAHSVSRGPESVRRDFTMRVPAEHDHDADLVMSEAARRITALEAENASLRLRVEWLWANARIVYYPGNGQYPIEHTVAGCKDGRIFLEPIMEKALGGKEGECTGTLAGHQRMKEYKDSIDWVTAEQTAALDEQERVRRIGNMYSQGRQSHTRSRAQAFDEVKRRLKEMLSRLVKH
jgi:hypothetical protein